MRAAIRAVLYFLFGALSLLALAEAALRVLPAMRGLHPIEGGDTVPLRYYEPHHPYRYSYGWSMLQSQSGRTNNYGHIAPKDFLPLSHPLIVVGDSFVESLMNPYSLTLQGVLDNRLGLQTPVYGLGISALSAADYIALARQARDEFLPRAAVFVIVDGDISESLQARPGGHHLRRQTDSFALEYTPRSPNPWIKRLRGLVGDSALYSYVRGNLKFSPADVPAALHRRGHGGASTSVPPEGPTERRQQEVVDWFLNALPDATGLPTSCTILLLDADRYAIYDPRRASTPKDSPATRSRLLSQARDAGFNVIDLGPLFRAAYARTGLKLDHWPVDRHWNERGHAVAAEAVIQVWSDPAIQDRCARDTPSRSVGRSG